jgi:hypothetical protein
MRGTCVRQWVLSVPIPLRLLLGAQPKLVTLVMQVMQRPVGRHLMDCARPEARSHRGHADPVSLTLC